MGRLKTILLASFIFSYLFSQPVFGSKDSTLYIGQQTLAFYDSARNREVKTEIWYPTNEQNNSVPEPYKTVFLLPPTTRNGKINQKKYPLILLSHGTGGGRLTMEWLAIGLVNEGFIVAAVDHWGNTYDNTIAEYFLKTWVRPQDISFALTKILQDVRFKPVIDEKRIGAAGFSLGGFTVIALAGAEYDINSFNRFIKYAKSPSGKNEVTISEFPELPELINDEKLIKKLKLEFKKTDANLKDSRIKAVFTMAPAIGQSFSKQKQFKNIKIPVQIVSAQKDRVAPNKTNAFYYHEMIHDSQLSVIDGEAGHYIFLNATNDALKEENPIIFKDHPSINRLEKHKEVVRLAVDFFKIM